MRVTDLSLADFRNYRSADVSFRPGLNLVIGRNGQGKTNLVEAIAYFASLGSHRVSGDTALIRAGCDTAVVRMRVAVRDREVLLEVQLNRGRANRAQVNRNGVRPRELMRWFSTVVFAPEDLSIVRGDPSRRRSFLDEAVIARNPVFAGTLADYERVVRQRTSLLKSARGSGNRSALDATLGVWDEQLVEHGTRIMLARRELVRDLEGPLRSGYHALVQEDHRPTAALTESVYEVLGRDDVSRETPLGLGGGGETIPKYESSGEMQSSGSENSPVERASVTTESKPSLATEFEEGLSAEHFEGVPNLVSGDLGPSELPHPPVERAAGESKPQLSHSRDEPSRHSTPGHHHLGDGIDSDSDVSRETLAADYRAALAAVRRQELERAVTLVGPHRDELSLELNALPVNGYASHGESWSFALGLRLALACLLREESPAGDPVLILDDVFAELDARRRARLMAAVEDFEQVIVTAAVEEDVPDNIQWHRIRIDAGIVVKEGTA